MSNSTPQPIQGYYPLTITAHVQFGKEMEGSFSKYWRLITRIPATIPPDLTIEYWGWFSFKLSDAVWDIPENCYKLRQVDIHLMDRESCKDSDFSTNHQNTLASAYKDGWVEIDEEEM